MLKILTAVIVVLALTFAFATPSFAAGGTQRARIGTRIKDKISAFSSKHAGKIAVGSMGVGAGATFVTYAGHGMPLKVAASAVVVGSVYSALRHGVEWALDNLTITR